MRNFGLKCGCQCVFVFLWTKSCFVLNSSLRTRTLSYQFQNVSIAFFQIINQCFLLLLFINFIMLNFIYKFVWEKLTVHWVKWNVNIDKIRKNNINWNSNLCWIVHVMSWLDAVRNLFIASMWVGFRKHFEALLLRHYCFFVTLSPKRRFFSMESCSGLLLSPRFSWKVDGIARFINVIRQN